MSASPSSASLPGALKPADFHILLVLSEGPMHGYGLMKAVEEQSRGRVRLEVGSLYRLIARLRGEGLLAPDRGTDDARRRDYAITERGREALAREVERVREVAALLREKELLRPGASGR